MANTPKLPISPGEEEGKISTEADEQRHIPFWELAPVFEFMCWVVVALAPMLRLVNGPPVTDDQAVIQMTLVILALTGAVSLRIYNWRHASLWRDLLSQQPPEEKE